MNNLKLTNREQVERFFATMEQQSKELIAKANAPIINKDDFVQMMQDKRVQRDTHEWVMSYRMYERLSQWAVAQTDNMQTVDISTWYGYSIRVDMSIGGYYFDLLPKVKIELCASCGNELSGVAVGNVTDGFKHAECE